MTEHIIQAVLACAATMGLITGLMLVWHLLRQRPWCVRELMDCAPWYYWRTVAGRLTKDEALILLSRLQQWPSDGYRGKRKAPDWFVAVPRKHLESQLRNDTRTGKPTGHDWTHKPCDCPFFDAKMCAPGGVFGEPRLPAEAWRDGRLHA